MPVPSYEREKQLILLKALSGGLTTVLEENEVELNDQAHLAKNGARTLVRVASLTSDDDASIKAVLATMGWTEVDLEGTDKIAMSMRIADLVATFREAKIVWQRGVEDRAEANIGEVARPVKTAPHRELQTAYEAKFGKLPKLEVPGRWFLGTKLEQINDNEPRLEDLREITSKEDGEEAGWEPLIDK